MSSPRKYHGIHKQQLFHWLASPADRASENKGTLTPEIRREYIDCLRGSLEDGIWVKTPRKPEEIKLRKFQHPLTKAMACFTEWSLNDSLTHTREYGRMALGFSKAWLINHGGQPITYYDHSSGSRFLKALVTLLKNPPADPKALEALLYLTHFTKRIHKPMPPATDAQPAAKKKSTKSSAAKPAVPKLPPDPFARFWSKTMPYLEEREWRVVEHPELVTTRLLVPNAKSDTPKFFLPYKPGEELFTLVLPDNQTVNEVLRATWFARRLFPKNGPHVTVLSLQDIGTF